MLWILIAIVFKYQVESTVNTWAPIVVREDNQVVRYLFSTGTHQKTKSYQVSKHISPREQRDPCNITAGPRTILYCGSSPYTLYVKIDQSWTSVSQKIVTVKMWWLPTRFNFVFSVGLWSLCNLYSISFVSLVLFWYFFRADFVSDLNP